MFRIRTKKKHCTCTLKLTLLAALVTAGVLGLQISAAADASGGAWVTERPVSGQTPASDARPAATTASPASTNRSPQMTRKADPAAPSDSISRVNPQRAQVLIEAAIIAVTLKGSETSSMSIFSCLAPGPGDYPSAAGATGTSNSLPVTGFAYGATTNASASELRGFDYIARLGTDLDEIIPALATNSRVKFLQRPRIQTSNAETATIFVGRSRPYPTGSYYGGGAYSGYSSIEQLQIGLTLDVTPYVGPDAFVELALRQEIDRVKGTVVGTNVGDVPITASREARARVMLRDHETILLGGWIEKDRHQTHSGVPVLKSIPLLGALFRGSSAHAARQEVIALIRPTVLPGPPAAPLSAKVMNTRH